MSSRHKHPFETGRYIQDSIDIQGLESKILLYTKASYQKTALKDAINLEYNARTVLVGASYDRVVDTLLSKTMEYFKEDKQRILNYLNFTHNLHILSQLSELVDVFHNGRIESILSSKNSEKNLRVFIFTFEEVVRDLDKTILEHFGFKLQSMIENLKKYLNFFEVVTHRLAFLLGHSPQHVQKNLISFLIRHDCLKEPYNGIFIDYVRELRMQFELEQ